MKHMIFILGLLFILFVISCGNEDSKVTTPPPSGANSSVIIRSKSKDPPEMKPVGEQGAEEPEEALEVDAVIDDVEEEPVKPIPPETNPVEEPQPELTIEDNPKELYERVRDRFLEPAEINLLPDLAPEIGEYDQPGKLIHETLERIREIHNENPDQDYHEITDQVFKEVLGFGKVLEELLVGLYWAVIDPKAMVFPKPLLIEYVRLSSKFPNKNDEELLLLFRESLRQGNVSGDSNNPKPEWQPPEDKKFELDLEPEVDIPLEDKELNELTENELYVVLVLGAGSKIIVQNTVEDHGLRVRDPAGLHLGEANIIGHMFNGATGTIVGDVIIASNLYWFEIVWDAIGKGRCEINDREPCIGWSAAVSPNDTRLLQEIR